MKRMLTICLLFGAMQLNAQSDTATQEPENTKPKFKLSLNYNSNLNYYGRTDSLQSSGFFPLAELYITPKFYVNAAPIFVNNAVQSFDYAGTVASVGFLNQTPKWITNVYVMKPFYKEQSELVQSALKLQSGLSVARLNKVANINIGGDLRLSDKVDFGAQAGLDHIIRLEGKNNKGVWVLDPSFYVFGGTQNYTRTYTKKQSGFPIPVGGTTQETENVSQFNILAYEASLPVFFVRGKWMLSLTPTYVIPQNLLTVKNRPDLSERGENRLYATAGVKYSF